MTAASQPPSSRLRPFQPTPFGRYTLLLPLSTGGMGEVFLARAEGTGGFEKLCVIKKILPQFAQDTVFVERFIHEARTLVKLSHGSIAQVHDMGLHEGAPYLALEYVDGKDLRRVLARAKDRNLPLPLTFSLFVMIRVLDALAYAHRKRDDEDREMALVHRDVSPQNVLVSYEGEVKVIDFGLAKSTMSAASTHPSIILGKFMYMSPEQAKQQKVDRRSDLYSVGLCLYELVSGINPFEGNRTGDLVGAVAEPRIPTLSEVVPLCPPQVSALVAKALAVDPNQRFQSAEEFRGKLQSLLYEIDSSAGPETVSRSMRDWFGTEFANERRLMASLKQWTQQNLPTPQHTRARDVDTGVLNIPPQTQQVRRPGATPTPPPNSHAPVKPQWGDGPTTQLLSPPSARRAETKPEVELGTGSNRATLVIGNPGGPSSGDGEPGSDPRTMASVPSLTLDGEFPWEEANSAEHTYPGPYRSDTPSAGEIPQTPLAPPLAPPPARLTAVPTRPGARLPESLTETQPGFRLVPEKEGSDTEPRVLVGTLVGPELGEKSDPEKTRASVRIVLPPRKKSRRKLSFAIAVLVIVLGGVVVWTMPRWTQWLEDARSGGNAAPSSPADANGDTLSGPPAPARGRVPLAPVPLTDLDLEGDVAMEDDAPAEKAGKTPELLAPLKPASPTPAPAKNPSPGRNRQRGR